MASDARMSTPDVATRMTLRTFCPRKTSSAAATRNGSNTVTKTNVSSIGTSEKSLGTAWDTRPTPAAG